MRNYIALNIRHLRSIKKLQQDEFANLFNVSRDAIGTYERGKATPKIETIQQICDHFDLSIDDFLRKDLSIHPSTYTQGVVHDDHTIQLYEQLLASKDEVIQSLRREIARLRGDDNNNVGQTG